MPEATVAVAMLAVSVGGAALGALIVTHRLSHHLRQGEERLRVLVDGIVESRS